MNINRRLTAAIAFVLIVWGLWFAAALASVCCGGSRGFGEMGDAFNMLNALFAGLAFAVIAAQLWIQKSQINDEKEARRRAERITALTTRIQVTFDKINNERELLLKVADSFKHISFYHEGDARRLEEAIEVRQTNVITLKQAIELQQKYPTWENARIHIEQDLKQLWDYKASLPIMEQILKWLLELQDHEKELGELLADQSKTAESDAGQS